MTAQEMMAQARDHMSSISNFVSADVDSEKEVDGHDGKQPHRGKYPPSPVCSGQSVLDHRNHGFKAYNHLAGKQVILTEPVNRHSKDIDR